MVEKHAVYFNKSIIPLQVTETDQLTGCCIKCGEYTRNVTVASRQAGRSSTDVERCNLWTWCATAKSCCGVYAWFPTTPAAKGASSCEHCLRSGARRFQAQKLFRFCSMVPACTACRRHGGTLSGFLSRVQDRTLVDVLQEHDAVGRRCDRQATQNCTLPSDVTDPPEWTNLLPGQCVLQYLREAKKGFSNSPRLDGNRNRTGPNLNYWTGVHHCDSCY